MDADLVGADDVLGGVVEEHAALGREAETGQGQLVDVGVRLMHLLHAGDHGALQQLFKARVLLEGQVEGLMRPVGQTPYAVAVGLQIRQQLDHARKRAGQRVRVVADVELEDVGEFLALFAYHIRVDVREILAGVHAVLVAEEAAGVVVGADAFHDLIGESAFQACAGVPVQQHAAEVENHVGDGGVGHDGSLCVWVVG